MMADVLLDDGRARNLSSKPGRKVGTQSRLVEDGKRSRHGTMDLGKESVVGKHTGMETPLFVVAKREKTQGAEKMTVRGAAMPSY